MKRLLVCLLLLRVTLPADDDRKTPREPKAQAEIMLRVVEAASDPAMANDAAALVPAELKKLLTFTRYRLLDSGYIRGMADEPLRIVLAGSLQGYVRFEKEAGEMEFSVRIEGPRPEKGSAPKLLETSVRGKSGETLVLGASRMSGGTKALIVLLTGKLLP